MGEQATVALTQRLVDDDSPWLTLHPVLLKAQGAEANSSEIEVSFDLDSFLNVLVTQFLRYVPSPKKLARVHEGIVVGKVLEEADRKHKQLKSEITKIEAARDGILRALQISDAAF